MVLVRQPFQGELLTRNRLALKLIIIKRPCGPSSIAAGTSIDFAVEMHGGQLSPPTVQYRRRFFLLQRSSPSVTVGPSSRLKIRFGTTVPRSNLVVARSGATG